MNAKGVFFSLTLIIVSFQSFCSEEEHALNKVRDSVVSVYVPLIQQTDSSGKDQNERTLLTLGVVKKTSGFVFDNDGYIVTSAAIITERDKKAVLEFSRGFKVHSKLIGLDKPANVAVFKLTEGVRSYASISRSNAKRVGEKIIAVGRDAGSGEIVTHGIISLISERQGNEWPVIETTAKVSYKMTGGPLVNMSGEVIGVNFAVFSRIGEPVPVSFALPISEVGKVVEQLKAEEESSWWE